MSNKHDTSMDKIQNEYLQYLKSSFFLSRLKSFINDMKADENVDSTELTKLTELVLGLENDTKLDKNAEVFCYWS